MHSTTLAVDFSKETLVVNVTQQNDSLVDHLLTLSNMTASILSQSRKLSPWQAAALKESASAMLSAVGGESKNKPVDLATSPSSSDQDKNLHAAGALMELLEGEKKLLKWPLLFVCCIWGRL